MAYISSDILSLQIIYETAFSTAPSTTRRSHEPSSSSFGLEGMDLVARPGHWGGSERTTPFHPTRPFNLPRGNGWFGSKCVNITASISILDCLRERTRSVVKIFGIPCGRQSRRDNR